MTEIHLNLFGALCLFGALQGIILVLIFVSSRTFAKESNRYLSLILLVFSVLNLVGTLEEMDVYTHYPVMRFVPIIWYSLIPPALYFFVQYLTRPTYRFQKRALILFIPFVLDIGYQFVEFIRFHMGKIQVPEDLPVHYFYVDIFESIASIMTLAISIWAIRSLTKYEKSLYENYSEVSDKSLLWLKRTLLGGCFLTIIWICSALTGFVPNLMCDFLTRTLWIGLSILIYWIGYSMLIKRELFISEELANMNVQEIPISGLSEKAGVHYEKLLDIMKNQRVYEDPNLNMTTLAKLSNLSNGYLSQIINQKEGKNFFDFVNQYRVNEVIKKFSDPKYDHYSIMAIAMDAGFKSKSTFNSVFKRITGFTPSEYRKK